MKYFVYAVMASQVVVLYWLAAPATFRLIYRSCLQRNPAWLEAHPEFAQRYRQANYPFALSFLLGLGWLIALGGGIANGSLERAEPRTLLWPALLWLLFELAVAAIEYARIGKHIPLPDRRRAVLGRRSVGDFINPAWIWPGCAMLLAIGLVYLWAYWSGRLDTDVLVWRLASLLLGAAIWSAALRYSVRRKKQALDDALGPPYRRAEVRTVVACLYLYVLVLAYHTLQDVFAMYLDGNLLFYTVLSLILQSLALIWMTFNFPQRKQHAL